MEQFSLKWEIRREQTVLVAYFRDTAGTEEQRDSDIESVIPVYFLIQV